MIVIFSEYSSFILVVFFSKNFKTDDADLSKMASICLRYDSALPLREASIFSGFDLNSQVHARLCLQKKMKPGFASPSFERWIDFFQTGYFSFYFLFLSNLYDDYSFEDVTPTCLKRCFYNSSSCSVLLIIDLDSCFTF